jgi:DedD protein
MAKQQTDEELNLRRKARRRLVGAIALTLAVVVILPMVLESEPRPTTQDIDLRIPAPDKVGEFVPGKVTPPEEPEVPKAAEPPASAASAVEAAPTAQATVPAVAQPVTAKPVVPQPKESATAKEPAAKVVDAGKKTEAETHDKPAAAEALVVQVGAYSNANTAKQELDKLKTWGFKAAYTEKAGDKVRVRVGPYTEREKAEKVRALLEKHGLHPVIMGNQ